MSADTSVLMMEVARLKERVNALEASGASSVGQYVEGWAKAAKILGVSAKCCVERAKIGRFPKPCKTTAFTRGTQVVLKPTWRMADIKAYQEQN